MLMGFAPIVISERHDRRPARPKVLLLDEPTTGLDTDNALELCKMLKASSLRPRATVLCYPFV